MKHAEIAFIPSESRLAMQKGIKFISLTVFTILLCSAISPVCATTYYVDGVNGLDTYNGLYLTHDSDPNGPWKTIGKAASVMVAGDTTYIRGGTYDISSTITPTNSGSSGGGYITFSAYQNEIPILDGANRAIKCFSLTSSHSYFRWVGLKFQNFATTGGGISITRNNNTTPYPHHMEILNCTMVSNKSGSTYYSWVKVFGAHDVTFAGCTFQTAKQGIELAVVGKELVYNVQILDCKFEDMTWDGVVAKAEHSPAPYYDPTEWCEDVYIAGCEASYCDDDGFDLFGRYFTIEHCVAHHMTGGDDSHGFKIYALDLPVDEGRYHADFYRCLTYNNIREGYHLSSLMIQESTDYTEKFRIINCTAANDNYGFSLKTNDIHPMDVIVKNSIIYSALRSWEITGTTTLWSLPPGEITISSLPSYLTLDSDYNLWYAGSNDPIYYMTDPCSLTEWQTFSGQDGSSISVNPTFDANYHPGNSMCIDGGTDVGLPYVGDAPDMGFFESGMVEVNCPVNYLTTGENWISVPVAPFNDGPYSVFKDLGTWPNSVYHNLYRYDTPTASTIEYPTYQSDTVQFGKIVPGGAYKLALDANQSTIHVTGIELNGTQTLTIGGSGTRDFYFGDPFNKALYKSHCSIKNGASEVSIDQAISNGWISNVQHFNPSSKSWETIGNILEKWHAYRLTTGSGTGELQLIMYDLPAGDLDGDGDVDLDDLDLTTENWLADNCGNRPVGALDEDCDVDFKDYAIFAGNWLAGV